MEAYGITDIGLLREKNQDSYLISESKHGDVFLLVCDGIGGAKAGEVASGEVAQYFKDTFPDAPVFKDLIMAREYIAHHVQLANRHVCALSRENEEYRGMGTTLTGLLCTKHGILSVNVGDSRVYGFLDHKAFRLTIADTLVNEMLLSGEITYEESINHPKKHWLVRAIGMENVAVDIHKVKEMEYYLVCSDGLHGYVSTEEILDIVYDEHLSLEEKTNKLMEEALLKGGYDNITLILAGGPLCPNT